MAVPVVHRLEPRNEEATPGSQRAETPDGRGTDSGSAVTGTKDPGMFVGEHWGMSAFTCHVPNGKRLYYRTEDGTLLLVEPNREQYIEHGRFDQPDRSDSPAWTHPVVANGKLYVRDQDLLLCYDIQAKK